MALRVAVGVESCTVVFLGGHFLFTSSDTVAVGCSIQPQHMTKTKLPEFPRLEYGSRGFSKVGSLTMCH